MFEENQAKEAITNFTQGRPTGIDDEKVPEFYNEIAKHFNFSPQPVVFIVVAHMVHTLPYFLQALTRIGAIAAIIPKASQYVPEVEDSLNWIFKDIIRRDINKTVLNTQPEIVQSFWQEMSEQYPDCKLMILDHGGYFAPRIDILNEFKDRLAGIVEHTWNGQIRYSNVLQDSPYSFSIPIFSIARSR